jgi:hypothetical protein
MPDIRFQLLTPHSGNILFGKALFANGTTIQPGLLCALDSGGSTVSLCGSQGTPFGFAYGQRYGVYNPTTSIFANGEALTVVKGRGMALMSTDFFSSGSFPSSNATALYTAANGLLGETSTNETQVATYIRTESLTEPVAGVGTSQSLALVEFDIPM